MQYGTHGSQEFYKAPWDKSSPTEGRRRSHTRAKLAGIGLPHSMRKKQGHGGHLVVAA